jgi:DNA-binding transcriptional ArsR family regulator
MTGQTTDIEVLLEMPSTASLIEQTDERIAEERERRHRIVQALRQSEAQIATLEAARKALVGRKVSRRTPSEQRAASRNRTAVERAGKGNVEAAFDYLAQHGRATKAEITRALGKNNGTVTYALRALEEEKRVRKTNVRVQGSDEYEVVSNRRRISRPGGQQ